MAGDRDTIDHGRIRPPLEGMTPQRDRAGFAAACVGAGIDHLFMADHVSFRGGHGTDGLIAATSFNRLRSTATNAIGATGSDR
jgi:hypothetical protein